MKKWAWWLAGGLLTLAGAYFLFFPSTYYSHDLRLEPAANELRPIIDKLEKYKYSHGSYPGNLAEIGVDDGKQTNGLPRIGYFAETGSNGKNEMDFAGSDKTEKIIGYEVYVDTWNGGLFYEHTDLHHGWAFNFGEKEQFLDL
jgi:hypothetical protein